MRQLLSPLRYPGSKAGLTPWMTSFLTTNHQLGKQFVEPYAGSAALGLNLLANNIISSLMLFERDPLLYSFWFSVFNRTEKLISIIHEFSPSIETREKLNWLRDEDHVIDDIELMGFAGLLFNRTGFSGVLGAGPIGGSNQASIYAVDCRFNKRTIIDRIRDISKYSTQVEIYFGNAMQALEDANNSDNSNRIFYIDPPYYVQGPKLYRYSYSFSDHFNLASTLQKSQYSWVLSYDDHPAIRHFYREFPIFEPEFRYSSKIPKKERELIFTSLK